MDDELSERRKSPKAKLAKKLAQADKLSAPAIRAIEGVESTRAALAVGSQIKFDSKIAPGLPGGPAIGFDAKEFFWFCKEVLHYSDMMPQPHDEMCGFLEPLFPDLSFKTPQQHFGMLLVPRNTFKSVIYSVGLPLYLLWKNKNLRLLLSGHRHDASKEQLRSIKWNIEHNEDFIALCGDWKPKFKEQKYAEDAIVIVGRTEAFRDPSIDTCGVDRSKVGAHPDVIICDDLHSETNIGTAIMRNKVLDHITNMYPMLQPGGTMLILATRWHHADAYGKLLSLDQKAVQEGRPATWKTLIRSCYLEDEKGKKAGLYFPTRLTESFLDDMRYKLGKTKFSLFYLNKPIDDDDRLFPKEQSIRVRFKYIFDQDMGLPCLIYEGQPYPVGVTLAWDPAGINPTDKSDFHGLTVVGCDQYERWLVPYAEAIKAKPDAVLAKVASVIMYYRPETIIIESVAQSGTWAYLLRGYMEREGLHCPPIVFYKPLSRQEKNERIEALQPKWANSQLVIDEKCRELLDQFDNFPQLDYDDLLDSLQMHKDYAQPPNENAYDLLYDNDTLHSNAPKGIEDSRRALGAYAGMGTSNWRSSSQTLEDLL